MESGIFPLEGKAHPGSVLDGSEVTKAEAGSYQIGAQHAQEDGDNLDHLLTPDVADDDDHNGQDGDPPVLVAVADGAAGERKADGDDDGTRHDGREETHHLPGAVSGEQTRQDEINYACREYSDAGIRQ